MDHRGRKRHNQVMKNLKRLLKLMFPSLIAVPMGSLVGVEQ